MLALEKKTFCIGKLSCVWFRDHVGWNSYILILRNVVILIPCLVIEMGPSSSHVWLQVHIIWDKLYDTWVPTIVLSFFLYLLPWQRTSSATTLDCAAGGWPARAHWSPRRHCSYQRHARPTSLLLQQPTTRSSRAAAVAPAWVALPHAAAAAGPTCARLDPPLSLASHHRRNSPHASIVRPYLSLHKLDEEGREHSSLQFVSRDGTVFVLKAYSLKAMDPVLFIP